MHCITLCLVNGATGLIVPQEVLDKLQLRDGDKVYLTESRLGFHVSRDEFEFTQQMACAYAGDKRA
ncbi:MAG: hypothetical protein HHJ09_13810 [Glaciimonas sp.]|nr:hypothetical protein [Glaciimonas sp.]